MSDRLAPTTTPDNTPPTVTGQNIVVTATSPAGYNVTAYNDNPAGPVPHAVGAGRIPDTPRHRFMNRLLVEP